jgi:glycosyltransferase involved in cell wall biosynthesis
MKILILSDDFPPFLLGGAGMMAFRITKEFAAQGHQVFVITTTDNPGRQGISEVDGIPVHRIYSKYHERWRSYFSLYNPAVVKEVKRIISEFRPDVVHAHNVHMHLSYASLKVCQNFGAKVFLTAHDLMSVYPGPFFKFIDRNDLSCPEKFDYRVSAIDMIKMYRLRYNPFRNTIIRNYLNHLNGGMIAVSNALKEALSQNGIKIKAVIHNGIDLPAWDISPNYDFEKKLGLSGANIVLFGGRLSGVKGGELILEAMRLVAKQNPKAKLLVIGRKDFYANRMEKKAASLGIGGKIIFAGWLSEDEMKKAYASSSVVIVPSVCFDSFPNSNIEAFASGKPVISTCFGGSREIVENGKNGYILNPFNVAALSNAIVDLLSNKAKANSFGKAGKALVKEKYLIGDSVKKYLSLFAE